MNYALGFSTVVFIPSTENTVFTAHITSQEGTCEGGWYNFDFLLLFILTAITVLFLSAVSKVLWIITLKGYNFLRV